MKLQIKIDRPVFDKKAALKAIMEWVAFYTESASDPNLIKKELILKKFPKFPAKYRTTRKSGWFRGLSIDKELHDLLIKSKGDPSFGSDVDSWSHKEDVAYNFAISSGSGSRRVYGLVMCCKPSVQEVIVDIQTFSNDCADEWEAHDIKNLGSKLHSMSTIDQHFVDYEEEVLIKLKPSNQPWIRYIITPTEQIISVDEYLKQTRRLK